MAAAKRSRASLRSLIAATPDDKLSAFLALDEAHDYTVALVGASLLDQGLEDALTSWLDPLSKQDSEGLFSETVSGPLATFSAKIRLASALKIFGPETRDDLNTIRGIRNVFAHAKGPISFEAEPIKEAVESLRYARNADTDDLPSLAKIAGHKRTFVICSVQIFVNLKWQRPSRYKQVTRKAMSESAGPFFVEDILMASPGAFFLKAGKLP